MVTREISKLSRIRKVQRYILKHLSPNHPMSLLCWIVVLYCFASLRDISTAACMPRDHPRGFWNPPCHRIGALKNILPRSTKKLETALGWTDGWRWRKKQQVPERSLVTAETGTWHGCWRTKQLTRVMMSLILEHQICSLTLTNTFWGPCVGKGKSKCLWVLERCKNQSINLH